MTGKRIWGLAATSAATLGMGFFLPRDLMQAWLRSASFYILFVLVLTWAFLMIRTYGGLALRLRRHLPALVTALGITVLVFTISPPRFKILADETNLIGVSLMMHETRTAAVPLEGVYTDYADPDVATTTVKRPMLFSFLTALLHAVIGYRAENGFILNFIVSVAVLWCFYLSVTRVLPNIYAIAGLLLLAAAPVYVMCATSSGFELLNMLLVVFVFLLLLDLEASGFDASRTELLLFSLVLLAHCRYEAIAVLLVVLPALAAPLWKRGFWAEMPWRVWLLPLFLLPVFWQRVLYWGTVEFNRVALGTYQQVESAFGWRNLLANFDDNLFVLMGLNPDYGFTPVLFALAAVGLYLWIRRKAGGRPVPVSTRWAFTALGVFVLLFLIISSFYWGNFGIPMDIRLSLVFLPFLCWSALYGVYCLRPDFHQRSGRRSASAVLLLLAAFHLLLYWPAGALQRPLQQLSLPYEYERVRDFLQNRYPDRGYTLLITDLPNLYLVQGYSALKINNTERLRSLLGQPNLFDRILVVQKFDRSSGEVLPAYRVLPANLRLHPVGSFALTSQTGIRISECNTHENRKDTKP
ncbi:MAG TPA: hypothetical protein ACFCUC_18755 [Desulfobacterales bacterium]